MSRNQDGTKISVIDIEDSKFTEMKAREHAQHAQMAFSKQRKQHKKKALVKLQSTSIEDRARLIDNNTMLLTEKIRTLRDIRTNKRKARWADGVVHKRRKVTLGKYCLKKVLTKENDCILTCYDRRGGLSGRVHTHIWLARV